MNNHPHEPRWFWPSDGSPPLDLHPDAVCDGIQRDAQHQAARGELLLAATAVLGVALSTVILAAVWLLGADGAAYAMYALLTGAVFALVSVLFYLLHNSKIRWAYSIGMQTGALLRFVTAAVDIVSIVSLAATWWLARTHLFNAPEGSLSLDACLGYGEAGAWTVWLCYALTGVAVSGHLQHRRR